MGCTCLVSSKSRLSKKKKTVTSLRMFSFPSSVFHFSLRFYLIFDLLLVFFISGADIICEGLFCLRCNICPLPTACSETFASDADRPASLLVFDSLPCVDDFRSTKVTLTSFSAQHQLKCKKIANLSAHRQRAWSILSVMYVQNL